MTRQIPVPICSLIVALALSACVPAPTAPAATEQLAPAMPLPTPLPPSWVLEDLLFQNAPENCHLPCWQNIVVGELTGEDAEAMFENVLQYPGSVIPADFGNIYGIDQGWLFNKEPLEYFHMYVWIDSETNRVRAIQFLWTLYSGTPDKPVSLRRLFQELGTPSNILILFTGTESAEEGLFAIKMIFSNGIVYSLGGHTPILNREGKGVIQLCLPYLRLNDAFVSDGSLLILEPLNDGLASMNSVQSYYLQDAIQDSQPLEEVFRVTPAQLVEAVLSGNNPCWDSKPFFNG